MFRFPRRTRVTSRRSPSATHRALRGEEEDEAVQEELAEEKVMVMVVVGEEEEEARGSSQLARSREPRADESARRGSPVNYRFGAVVSSQRDSFARPSGG